MERKHKVQMKRAKVKEKRSWKNANNEIENWPLMPFSWMKWHSILSAISLDSMTQTHTHTKRIHLFSLTLNSFGDAIKNLNKWARFFLLSIWKKRTDVAVFFLVHSSKCRKIHVSKAGQRYVNSTLDIWPSFEATRWHNEGKLLGMNV